MRNHRHVVSTIATALALCLAAGAVEAGSASQVVVLLPGQTLTPGGIGGTPLVQKQREPFVVRVVAVDAFGNPDFSYAGPILGLHTSEVEPTEGVRLGSSISGVGAAASIPPGGGELRISLNGENYRDYAIGSAATGDEVCDAIEAALIAGNAGRDLAVDCSFDAGSSRYTLLMHDRRPLRGNLQGSYFENSVTVDPAHGLAPALHLGVSEPPSSDPNDPAEFTARRLIADPALDLVFDRGFAAHSVVWNSLTDLGQGKTLDLDLGASGLPVVATAFEVEAADFEILSATVLGDGQGGIDRVRLVFNQDVDPVGIANQAIHFTLEDSGIGSAIAGASLTLEDFDLHGYPADLIEVTFGGGLPKTDITNVKVKYTPPASGALTSTDGVPAGNVTLESPRLVDGAPPVLTSASFQDLDGNGGLDRTEFFFSEPVAFSGGRGVSVSGFDPVTNGAPASVPLPASLVLAIDGEPHVLSLEHPTDPQAAMIPGGSSVADAIAIAARSVGTRPAYANFTCEFVNGRYILRAGIPLRSVAVLFSPAIDDAGALLRLGSANGGIERPGTASAIGDLSDFIVLGPFEGQDLRTSLLEGQGASALQIVGDALQIELTNVPNSGTGTPAFIWKDDGDLGFVADRAPRPNLALAANNLGFPAEFHASGLIRIRDDDSVPGDGVISTTPGFVSLDATETIPPLLPSNTPSDLTFEWNQIDGAPVIVDDADSDDATAPLLQAGSYVFELTVTMLEGGAPPAFNPYLHGDGTLSKSVSVSVTPGPVTHAVVLLPGQSLRQGVATHAEAIDGASGIATPDVPYDVHAICTDAFFNVVDCPVGATAALVTTDPADVEPPSRPLSAGGAIFTLLPATPGSFSVDVELVGGGGTDGVPQPYVVGSAWNVTAEKIPGMQDGIRLSWDGDPRPVTWNVYSGTLPIADLDDDGQPDAGYGSCASGDDPDPSDTTFDDVAFVPPGEGRFYLGTMVLDGQETSPGVNSAGQLRLLPQPCP